MNIVTYNNHINQVPKTTLRSIFAIKGFLKGEMPDKMFLEY